MGNLLQILRSDVISGWCGNTDNSCDIFVDFETSQPTDEDKVVYNEAEEFLKDAAEILAKLRDYKGATKEIREAIGNPSQETEAEAWMMLLPMVGKLRSFHQFSKKLNDVVPNILRVICSVQNNEENANKSLDMAEQLDSHQALVKQLAKVLEFVLRFDERKMGTPAVQNDFSYYRRSVQRNRNSVSGRPDSARALLSNRSAEDESDAAHAKDLPISETNEMSLFFAHATPMLNALSAVVTNHVKDSAEFSSNTTNMLSMMSRVCQRTLDAQELRQKIKFEETEALLLRVMTSTVILYDHVHPSGAFVKGSGVDVKGCVKVLREARDKTQSESLLNALRYTTKNLNTDSTPKNIRSLLDAPL